jgi:hypothetical protein
MRIWLVIAAIVVVWGCTSAASAQIGGLPRSPGVGIYRPPIYRGPSIYSRGYSQGYVPRDYTYYGPKYVPQRVGENRYFGPRAGGYYYPPPRNK